ncbi:alpha/beta-hydrolase [Auriscalpium vulgare]|uniref:Alpha/beta-hydrolase n=1 Tax=Auriscalpium vulgare TaxID=40419 RepID=A0ACB8RDM8_9AGAM|nr:alpha/beta-hydrolase [Auriscalpium vulgare]
MSSAPDPVLARPPGSCCAVGFKHTGEPAGVCEVFGGMNTYVARPPQAADKYEHILFYFADVFGPLHINNQLLADTLASKGYLVLAPDYFEGDPVYPYLRENHDFDVTGWLQPKRIKADAMVSPWIAAAKAQYGNPTAKYAAVGYCFGAPDVMRLVSGDEVTAGALVHPALLNESHFRDAKRPLFLSVNDDFIFPQAARHRAEALLTEAKTVHHVQCFVGFPHGFAARGRLDNTIHRWAKEQSADGVASWFDQWLKNDAAFEMFELVHVI